MQLGLGVVTIVTTSTVYVTWLAAMLAGSPVAGAAIGATFGLVRAIPVFAVAGVRRPDQLMRTDGTLRRLATPAHRAALAAASLLGVLSLSGALGW